MEEFFSLPMVKESDANAKLLKAALLERATAGLIIDSFLTNRENSISKYLIEATREQVKKLIEELK